MSRAPARVSDRLTAADRKIWDRMPLSGRLMVRRDQRDADIMRTRTLASARQGAPDRPKG